MKADELASMQRCAGGVVCILAVVTVTHCEKCPTRDTFKVTLDSVSDPQTCRRNRFHCQ